MATPRTALHKLSLSSDNSTFRRFDVSAFRRFPPAFSLIELMIAIVILGLGLVMVATMFPVAWQRAREMSEVTAQQAVIPAIESTIRGLVPVATFGTSGCQGNADGNWRDGCNRLRVANEQQHECISSAGFAGDMVFDPRFGSQRFPTGRIVALSDTRVHALHVENVAVVPRRFVQEDPWRLERMSNLQAFCIEPNPEFVTEFAPQFDRNTYHTPRVELGQRVFPPMGRRAANSVNINTGDFTGDDVAWDEQFESRRFAWAVFHRLRQPIGPDLGLLQQPPPPPPPVLGPSPNEQAALVALNSVRTFDMYYVTLRRTRATNRYARQQSTPANVPNPYQPTVNPVVPEAMPPSEDVMLPVAWRVQIRVPNTIKSVDDQNRIPGIPTEVLVPPAGITGGEGAGRMVVQMFPPGTQFIDEINGQVYRVITRRIVDPDGLGTEAVLTLDREITIEDVDFQDPFGSIDDAELLRTVWVFPPPAESRDAADRFPTFDGPSPVVAIDVRPMTLRP